MNLYSLDSGLREGGFRGLLTGRSAQSRALQSLPCACLSCARAVEAGQCCGKRPGPARVRAEPGSIAGCVAAGLG